MLNKRHASSCLLQQEATPPHGTWRRPLYMVRQASLFFCHVVVHALITSVRGQRSPSLRNFDRRASWRSGSRWTTFSMIHCPLFSLIKNNAFFHWPSCKLFKSVQNSCSCWSSWVSPLVHTVARLVNFLPLHVEFYLVILLCCHHS